MARGSVNTAGNVAKTKRILRRAFETQVSGAGFSFVETAEAPRYLADNLGTVHTRRRAERCPRTRVAAGVTQ